MNKPTRDPLAGTSLAAPQVTREVAAMMQRVQALQAEREARDAELEGAKVYQLALWPDDKRAMPTEFIRSALFAGIQAKHATHLDGVQIASANDLTIIYTGQRLTQVHADVWEGIMHLARQFPAGQRVTFRARQFLRLIGRHTGKSQRDELKRLFRQLTATSVEINDTRNNRRFWGSLLPCGADRDEDDDTLYVVELNRNLAKLFDRGFSMIDWQQRRKLLKKPLALWLQHFFSDHRKPVTVAFLHQHSGSTARSMRHFREQLRRALEELQDVGVLASWRIDDADTVHVSTAPLGAGRMPPSPAPQPVPEGQLALPGVVPVSDKARAQFRRMYPEHDVEKCIEAWHAWDGSRRARSPDAAFVGFAKHWAK